MVHNLYAKVKHDVQVKREYNLMLLKLGCELQQLSGVLVRVLGLGLVRGVPGLVVVHKLVGEHELAFELVVAIGHELLLQLVLLVPCCGMSMFLVHLQLGIWLTFFDGFPLAIDILI